jgi:hypothetical protein
VVGEATDFPDRYRNLKAQLYRSLRERSLALDERFSCLALTRAKWS